MKRVAFVLGAAFVAAGCSSLFHFADPTVQSVSCAITNIVLGPLEVLASTLGIPVDLLQVLYGDACNVAAQQGMSQHDAEQYALKHVEELGKAMKAAGMRFDPAARGQ